MMKYFLHLKKSFREIKEAANINLSIPAEFKGRP